MAIEKSLTSADAAVDENKLLAVASAKDVQWQEVAPDFGIVWDFDVNDTLIGVVVARRLTDQEDMNNPGTTRKTWIYDLIAPDQERYSVWGTWSIDNKMQHIPDGTIIRIKYKGMQDFVSDEGPRRVRRFAVSAAALPNGA